MTDTQPLTFGILGKYYSIRHALGHYRSACVVSSYSLTLPIGKPPGAWLQNALEYSLQATIKQHSGLCYAPTDQQTEDSAPGFKQVGKIHRDDVMEYIKPWDDAGPKIGKANYDDILCRTLETAHAKLWPSNKPAWRAIILHHESDPSDKNASEPIPSCSRVDIAFIAHHTIADGLSGIAFHNAMMENFPEAFGMGARSIWPMILDEIQSPPTPMEDLIDIPRSTTSAPSPAKDPVWTGGIVSLPTVDDFISRIQLINIPPKNLSWMIKTCKQHGVSINSYLHGHICACLCRAIGGTPDFRAVTPFSVRGLTKASPRDIVNHISYMSTHVSNAKMKGIRESIPHSLTEHECIINLARDFGQDIAAEVKRFPRDSALANLWQIQDIRSHCLNQEGKKRECTYELSNLGATENQASADSPLTLERLMFTQSGMVAGPAIGFNCVSIRGGPLTMAITWQYGIVDESLINTLAHELEKRLMQERPQTPAPVEETGGNRPGRWR